MLLLEEPGRGEAAGKRAKPRASEVPETRCHDYYYNYYYYYYYYYYYH